MDVPVYTPSNVSKLLPLVEIVTGPLRGACHCHQTDLPPGLPASSGSPGSFVASRLEERTSRLSGLAPPEPNVGRLVKSSLNESSVRVLVAQFTVMRHSSNPRLTAS